MKKNIILTVDVVEPALVRAVKLLGKELGSPIEGIALVDTKYSTLKDRLKDTTGTFKEIILGFDSKSEVESVLSPIRERILAATYRYEETLQPFAKLIPFLPNVLTAPAESLYYCTNKNLMRQKLEEYDSKLVPKFIEISEFNPSFIMEATKNFTFPLIIKPSGLSKSLLVQKCKNQQILLQKLENTFHRLKSIYEREIYPGKPSILVEEMMEGKMFSTDSYVMNDGRIFVLPPVRVVTGHEVGHNGFYGYERSLPSDLSNNEFGGATNATISAVKALKLKNATAHTEMYLTKDGWKIIEVAARLGGYRDMLYREAYGIEPYLNDLRVKMGVKPSMPKELKKYASAINIYPEKEGLIADIKGMKDARKVSSLVDFKVNARRGDEALFSTSGGNPVIEAVLSSKNKEQLKNDVDLVRSLLKISVD